MRCRKNHVPNAETRQAMEDVRLGRNLTEATPDTLFKPLPVSASDAEKRPRKTASRWKTLVDLEKDKVTADELVRALRKSDVR